MKPRKEHETDEHYIGRLEQRNSALKQHNDNLTKWLERVNENQTRLAIEGSLVFQAMAEKAGVRSHPSVTKVVEFFDGVAHAQWPKDAPDEIQWPTEWDLDEGDYWSGDADMSLNSPLSELIEFLNSPSVFLKFSKAQAEHIAELGTKIEKVIQGEIEVLRARAGCVRKEIEIPDIPNDVGWAILDLAQDMATANEWLRRDLRAGAYRRICSDLYKLAFQQPGPEDPEPMKFQVKVIGDEVPF